MLYCKLQWTTEKAYSKLTCLRKASYLAVLTSLPYVACLSVNVATLLGFSPLGWSEIKKLTALW